MFIKETYDKISSRARSLSPSGCGSCLGSVDSKYVVEPNKKKQKKVTFEEDNSKDNSEQESKLTKDHLMNIESDNEDGEGSSSSDS